MKNITGFIFVLSALIFSGVFLRACSALPEKSNIPKPSISYWLSKPLCEIPCWENITPGITDIREALSLLNKVAGIHIDNLNANDLSGSCIWWDYEYGSDNFPGGGMLCTGINNPDIVEEIHISTYNSSPTIYLKDVINTLGEPDYITIVPDRNSCSPHLLYKERGLVLSFAFRSCKKKYQISDSMVIEQLYFFNPTNDPYSNGRIRKPYYYNPQLLKEWSGYGYYKLEH